MRGRRKAVKCTRSSKDERARADGGNAGATIDRTANGPQNSIRNRLINVGNARHDHGIGSIQRRQSPRHSQRDML
jgi:hypothetical protein